MSEVPGPQSPELQSPLTGPPGSQPSKPLARERSRLRKILTPLILGALGLMLLPIALLLYPSTTGLSPPPYPHVSVLTKFHIFFIAYGVHQVSPAVAEIEMVVVVRLPGPPAGTPAAKLILEMPPGITFRDCKPPACKSIQGTRTFIWTEPLAFNRAGSSGVIFFFVKAASFGVSFNGITAYAAIPEAYYNGPGQPTLSVNYRIPSAASYDWSSFPTAGISKSLVGWTEPLVTSDTAARVAVGVDHARQATNDYQAFVAGALIGLAGAAFLSAIQEAFHAFD